MHELGKIEKVPTRSDINNLQMHLATLPQDEPVMEHYFSNGMYCRKAYIKAGTRIVGKVHKEPHFFICISGTMKVWTDEDVAIVHPGDVICSKAGVKRVILALTDVVGMNIHKTDNTDLDEIEKELVEEDESALFDSGNKLRNPAIESNITPLLSNDSK